MSKRQDMQQRESGNGGRPLYWVSRDAAKRALIALHTAAIIAVLMEVLFPFPADEHAVERVHALDFIGSYALYGFVACVILVLLGRLLRRGVMRNEEYYGEEH